MKYLILFLSLCSIIPVNAQSLDIPLITVDGSAIIYTAPDEVILNFYIQKTGDSVAEVRKTSEAQAKELMDFLQDQGIPKKHIQTQYMNIGPSYNHKNNKVNYYRANQSMSVCLDNLNDYDRIVDGILALGIEQISNPVFKTTEIKRIKDEARQKAMLKARGKAILLAEALGQKIGQAKLIEEINFNRTRNTGAYANNTESQTVDTDEDFSFAPGQLEIRAMVKVSFELLD